jgi:hypothetical protein
LKEKFNIPDKDAELTLARNEGAETAWPGLVLAASCFLVAMAWAAIAGIRFWIWRRIFSPRPETEPKPDFSKQRNSEIPSTKTTT